MGGCSTGKQLKQNNEKKNNRKEETRVPSVPAESIAGIRHLITLDETSRKEPPFPRYRSLSDPLYFFPSEFRSLRTLLKPFFFLLRIWRSASLEMYAVRWTLCTLQPASSALPLHSVSFSEFPAPRFEIGGLSTAYNLILHLQPIHGVFWGQRNCFTGVALFLGIIGESANLMTENEFPAVA